jgi:hypothetical protein
MVPKASQEFGLIVDAALRNWRQGDVCLDANLDFIHTGDLSRPGSSAAMHAAQVLREQGEQLPTGPVPLSENVPGFVILTQTCDIIRSSALRPYVEVSPLVRVPAEFVEDVRRLRRPAFAYIPVTAKHHLVADLDRVMTVEKAVVATWRRVPGWVTDDQMRAFAEALARMRARFAFPDDFVAITAKLQERFRKRHSKQHPEGIHLRALREIRVRAAPAWDSAKVRLGFWFIKDAEPLGVAPAWADWVDNWMALLDQSGRFQVEYAVACRLEDLTARDYVESDRLDLDALSGS